MTLFVSHRIIKVNKFQAKNDQNKEAAPRMIFQ